MMAKNIPKMPLPKLDDLFTTEEERTNDKLEKVIDIKISDIDDFPDHPFKVIDDDELIEDIVIDENRNIKVIFKCEDKYFEALDFIKRQNYDIISSS